MSYVAERTATLVVGWGNELRGDDAAGRLIARSVQGWSIEGVRVLELHQLLPEVAEALSDIDRVVFVDTQIAIDHVQVRRITRGETPFGAGGMGHRVGPADILELAGQLYQAEPEAWLVTVPGAEFEVGSPPGELTRRAMGQAEIDVRELLQPRRKPCRQPCRIDEVDDEVLQTAPPEICQPEAGPPPAENLKSEI